LSSSEFHDLKMPRNIFEQLENLEVFRVTRCFIFEDHKRIRCETIIDFRNKGNFEIKIVPTGLYKKEVLVGYTIVDQNGSQCSPVTSSLGDKIIIEYVFHLMLKNFENIKEVLKTKGNLEDSDLDVIKNKIVLDFNSELKKNIFDAMWESEEKIEQILTKSILEYLPGQYRDQKAKFDNITIEDLLGDLKVYLKRFDSQFVVFTWLNNPIKTRKTARITVSRILNLTPKRIRFPHSILPYASYCLEFPLYAFLPKQEIPLHLKITPPEGCKFVLGSQSKIILSKYLNFYHRTNNNWEPCSAVPNSIKIRDLGNNKWEVEEDDIRCNLSEKEFFIYIRSTERSGERSRIENCIEKDHKSLVSLTIDSPAPWYYVLFLFILIVIYLLTSSVVGGFFYLTGYLSLVLATIFPLVLDYSRRSAAERYFITYNLFFAFAILLIVFALNVSFRFLLLPILVDP